MVQVCWPDILVVKGRELRGCCGGSGVRWIGGYNYHFMGNGTVGNGDVVE